MGALYGYLNFNHKPEPNIPDQMRSASAYWGRDNHFFYSTDHIFIGNNHRFNTPEAVFEQQPYEPIPNNFVFFTGRIDNRKELTLKLNIKDEPTIPDGLFVSKAWEKYKTNITDHIIGDWVIVVWDNNEHKLHILRDHHGYSAMYYYSNENFFAFGTCIKSLLELSSINKILNINRIFQLLAASRGNGIESGYLQILRLPPANIIEINHKLQVEKRRYWFPEKIETLIYKNEDNYYAQFLDEYSRAVEVRLRSNKAIGSELSGGLDSGSIVSLAAAHLKKKGDRLSTFTSVPAFDINALGLKNRLCNEGSLAKKTADYSENIDWYPINALDTDPFKAIVDSIKIHDEPFPAVGNQFWMNEIKKAAIQLNIGTILTGQGGNGTVSWPTPGLIHKMAKKRDLINLRNIFSYYGWRYVLLPQHVRKYIKWIISNKPSQNNIFYKYSALNIEFIKNHYLTNHIFYKENNPNSLKNMSPRETRLKLIGPGVSIVGFLHSQSAAMFNVEMRDPTLDKKVIELCFSIPDKIYVNHGKDRMLLRQSFEGKMPTEVIWNKLRGKQASDIAYRLVKFKSTGYELINEMFKSNLCIEMLDLKKMKYILDSLSKNVLSINISMVELVFLKGIMIGLYLLRNDKLQSNY